MAGQRGVPRVAVVCQPIRQAAAQTLAGVFAGEAVDPEKRRQRPLPNCRVTGVNLSDWSSHLVQPANCLQQVERPGGVSS